MRDIVPVFCDRCALLALAELDGAPLCADCLLAQVKRVSGDVIGRIVPLNLEDASYSIVDDPSEKSPFLQHVTTPLREGRRSSKTATPFAAEG